MRDKLISILRDMGRVAFTNEEKADYLLQHGVAIVEPNTDIYAIADSIATTTKQVALAHLRTIFDDEDE